MAIPESKIIALLDKIASERNLEGHEIELSSISSGGANYTSTLFVATVTSKNHEDLQLFIKVAAMGEKIRSSASIKIYDVENFIYTKLQDKFRKLEDEHGVVGEDRLKMPKYYGANTVPREEIIVLENLVSRGFDSHDRTKSVDWFYAAAATRELAKLHALSIALERENREEFDDLIEYFRMDADSQSIEMTVFFESSKASAMRVVTEENRNRLQNFLDNMSFLDFWDYFKASSRQVLLHGDYRPSNMLHRARTDGTVEVIPVDYQTLRGGGPVVDLYYFIFTGTDKKFRANYYESLLEHYYTELCAALTRLGLDPNEKYSREDYDAELKEKLPFGLGVAVFTLPIVTVEAENAPVVDEHMDISSFSIQKTSSLFEERLNGVVDDFVRWGVL